MIYCLKFCIDWFPYSNLYKGIDEKNVRGIKGILWTSGLKPK
jgi:hypothetical protein